MSKNNVGQKNKARASYFEERIPTSSAYSVAVVGDAEAGHPVLMLQRHHTLTLQHIPCKAVAVLVASKQETSAKKFKWCDEKNVKMVYLGKVGKSREMRWYVWKGEKPQ